MSIVMCMHNFIKIYQKVQEIGPVFLRIWSSAKPRPTIHVISQSLRLDLVNIKVYAKAYRNIPNGLRVMGILTFCPWTNSSQTVRTVN